jgi:ABC-type branched-subunit amino acid transport system permease subunit
VKGRFPPDLLVVVFGPVLVAAVVFALGSLIFYTEQLRGSVAGYRLLVLGVLTLVGMLFFRRRRRH